MLAPTADTLTRGDTPHLSDRITQSRLLLYAPPILTDVPSDSGDGGPVYTRTR